MIPGQLLCLDGQSYSACKELQQAAAEELKLSAGPQLLVVAGTLQRCVESQEAVTQEIPVIQH